MIDRFKSAYIIWISIILHLIWGFLIILSPQAIININAIYELRNLTHLDYNFLSLVYFSVAILAFLAVKTAKKNYGWKSLLLMMPQQFVLFISGYGALRATLNQAFADGILRSWQFILADQSIHILLAVFHTITIINLHTEKLK